MVTAQPGGVDVRAAVAEAELHPLGYLANASNHTLLCRLGDEEDDLHAVYKPRAGERPLWDFASGTLCQREVAAYLVSESLGWDLVPLTVLRDGPLGPGSVQLFIDHDPAEHYFALLDSPRWRRELARIAVLDLVINNADRKGSHVLRAGDQRLYGIDHGVTFHVQPKLRTVIWELGGHEIPAAWAADLRALADRLADPDTAVSESLARLLDPAERAVLRRRALVVAGLAALPSLAEDHRPYPWPPI